MKNNISNSIMLAEGLAQSLLDYERYAHVKRVERCAVKLARLHGADVKKVRLAALLHDITKLMPPLSHLQLMCRGGIISVTAMKKPHAVWHGFSAAEFAKQLGVTRSAAVLNAVRWHTTARPHMSEVEMIVFLADKLEDERDYNGVEKLRRAAAQNLKKATYMLLDENIQYLKASGKPIDTATQDAFSYYEAILRR